MAKKVKLQLEDLTVKSFITALGADERERIKGGVTEPGSTCPTNQCSCLCSIYPPTEDDPWDCTDPKGCIDTVHNC